MLCAAVQAVLEDRVAPIALLYLQFPHPPTAAACHQLLSALLPALPPPQREQMGPFYVDRALEAFSGTTDLQPLQQGVASLLRTLPRGSTVTLYCLQALLTKCGELGASRWEELPSALALGKGSLLSTALHGQSMSLTSSCARGVLHNFL